MERKEIKPKEQDNYLREQLKLQRAAVVMQGLFTLGFLYFAYIVFMKPYTDFFSNFVMISFMIMLFIGVLYTLLPIKITFKS